MIFEKEKKKKNLTSNYCLSQRLKEKVNQKCKFYLFINLFTVRVNVISYNKLLIFPLSLISEWYFKIQMTLKKNTFKYKK